jgi:hypothetical protein
MRVPHFAPPRDQTERGSGGVLGRQLAQHPQRHPDRDRPGGPPVFRPVHHRDQQGCSFEYLDVSSDRFRRRRLQAQHRAPVGQHRRVRALLQEQVSGGGGVAQRRQLARDFRQDAPAVDYDAWVLGSAM